MICDDTALFTHPSLSVMLTICDAAFLKTSAIRATHNKPKVVGEKNNAGKKTNRYKQMNINKIK